MRRVFKKSMAVALAAAMVVTLAPASADAAKKPSMKTSMKKSVSVKVGKTTTLKIKNGKKNAKVTWKSSKKKVAKITKSSKTSAKIKGVKKGTAKITAAYTAGKTKAKLTCKVTVKKSTSVTSTATPAPASAAPVATATAVPNNGGNQTAAPTQAATETTKPSATPTKVPGTPTPSPTPSPVPKNTTPLNAYKVGAEKAIVVDGTVEETWGDSKANNLILDKEATKVEQVRGEITTKAATAKVMWADDAAYILMNVTKDAVTDKDSVTVYFDENDKASKETMVTFNVVADKTAKADGKYEAVSKKTADGYLVEAKINVKAAKEVGAEFKIDLQVNEEKGSLNVYDTRSNMVYDAEKDSWSLGDETVSVGEKPELMGSVSLLAAMAQSTSAFFTDKGEAIRTAAKLDSATWDNEPAEGETEPALKSKKMTFVDTSFWKDTYAANGEQSIYFTNVNIPDHKGNAEKLSLGSLVSGTVEGGDAVYASTREQAEGYIVWDADYLYVLFNVADKDISPANEDHYTTDSTEFFLDEDYSGPSAYDTEGKGDEVQLRVDAADNAFSANDAGTGTYSLVGHAVNKDENGYQIEYIIKLNNKHQNGDIMGMDLQINDCFTVPAVAADPDNNVEETPATADRAATLTAYDTTNNAYQDPSCFGRIKLVNKDAATVDPSESPLPSAPASDELVVDLSKFDASNANTTVTKNSNGTVTLAWPEGAASYSGVNVLFDTPQDLSGYTNVVVETTEDSTCFCFAILDNEKKSEWNAPASVGLRYGASFPATIKLADLLNKDYNGDQEGGTDADYKNVKGISFAKGTPADAVTFTIKSIKFTK